uniref:Uncharacterized protein n=1 Tax=Setaria digitata TaxID=48799 RepID=A0A915PZX6_9BILA
MLTTLLLYAIGFAYISATNKIKGTNDVKIEMEHSQNEDKQEKKSRLLLYEYNFWSETRIYESEGKKLQETITETINATYSFDILHYDTRGNVLGRYRFMKCTHGLCQYDMPDVYVDFVQGGNNLNGLYMVANLTEKNWKANWNVLFAVIYSIMTPAKGGAGDKQNVITPYGLCHYRFSKPKDKIFRRQINHCQFDGIRNFTLISGLTEHNYQQSVLYIQNTKSNPDIVEIETEEVMTLKSSLISDWSLTVKTRSKIEMTNRTMLFVKSFCSRKLQAGECAENAFKAKRMGGNWKEINQKLNTGVKKERSKANI